MIEYFNEVKVQKASDLILEQIRGLIRAGKLNPGDRLPSERALVERFGAGRGPIREALKRLEFYGILKTEPKKGTIVASLGVKALEGLISSIIQIDRRDFESLFETRAVLEVHSARVAATRADNEALVGIEKAHEEYRLQVESGKRALEEDHVFHLRIAEASRNTILVSLIGLITPDVISMNRDFVEKGLKSTRRTLSEHTNIVNAIVRHDADDAAESMATHMQRSHERRFGEPLEKKIL